MKKIIIIAPHFPPSAMPPAQRVRLLVKHLHEFGYETVIITVKHKYREEKEDEWMVELVGNNFKKIELYALPQKWTRKIGIGDLGLRFIPFLLPKLLMVIIKERPAFILYPVPPWYILLIAPIVRFLSGVKYGIDFIDPWFYEHKVSFKTNFKQKLSRIIAKACEKWVVQNSSVIFSVSEGINNDLKRRCPKLNHIPLKAIPYGAEPSDFDMVYNIKREYNQTIVRYIGAVWEDAYPVLDSLLKAINTISYKTNLKVEFYGTSYAGEGLSKPRLDFLEEKYQLGENLIEFPQRVSYRKAVELTLTADILLLFGGMQPYYAASKLMGLIVSQKPFIAFLHRDSYPAKLLEKINYPYKVLYSDFEDHPSKHVDELIKKIDELIINKNNFKQVSLDNPNVQEHTAFGMTKMFIDEIDSII